MIEIAPARESDVVLAFLKAEIDHSPHRHQIHQLLQIFQGTRQELIDDGDLSVDWQNAVRAVLLDCYCGYLTRDRFFTEGQGGWPSTPLIAEVSDADIVMLFTPSGGSNPQATGIPVDCGELDIVEIPHGSCPLRLHVRRRYGSPVQLGQITRWGDRNLPQAAPTFNKGGNVYHATFSKPGSSETRSLNVYASADGSNSFLLETSVGERAVADNVEISRRFMLLEVNYRAAGFNRSGSGTGGSPHPLFIW